MFASGDDAHILECVLWCAQDESYSFLLFVNLICNVHYLGILQEYNALLARLKEMKRGHL